MVRKTVMKVTFDLIVVAIIILTLWVYNPYMDFAGHIAFAQPCLIISALLVSIQAFIK